MQVLDCKGRIVESNICPCCKRRIVAAKPKTDKKLAEDIAKATHAIELLTNWSPDPNDTPITRTALQLAVIEELDRMTRAIQGDYDLLWRIYRRKDKASGYGIVAVQTLAEVA